MPPGSKVSLHFDGPVKKPLNLSGFYQKLCVVPLAYADITLLTVGRAVLFNDITAETKASSRRSSSNRSDCRVNFTGR